MIKDNPDHGFVLSRVSELLETEELFNSYFMNNPVPAWYKIFHEPSKTLSMRWVNKAYTEQTGISIAAYEAQSDKGIWSEDTANQYSKNDFLAIQKRIPIPCIEYAPNPTTQVPEVWVGWKWPHIKKSRVLGVWGMANAHLVENWELIKEKHPFYVKYGKGLDNA